MCAKNERLECLFNITPDIVYFIDLEGRLQHWNAALEKFCGLSANEMKGRSCMEFVCEQDRALVADDIQKVFSNGSHVNTYRFIRSDGVLVPFHCNGTVTFNKDGEKDGFAGLGRDITESEQACEALRKSEERWKFALEGAGDGVWDWNIQTGEATYSRRYKEMLGFTDNEIWFGASEWLNRVHPLDKRRAQRVVKAHLDGKTPSAEIEVRMLCKDGSWKWIHGRGMVVSFSGDGKPLRLVGTNTDITERKQAEMERHLTQFAMENASFEVYWLDKEANIHYVNKKACQTLGYSKEELTKLAIPDIDPLFPVDQWNSHWESLKRDKAQFFETQHKCKDGRIIPVEISANYVKFGEHEYNVAYSRDITERKQAKEKIENLAFYDPLTGLPNRRLLIDRLKQALASSARNGREGALLFIDLDNFKSLNDTLGHDVGDLLLQQVALRLESCVREGDTVSRLGGDEFVVMLEDLSEHELESAAQAETVGEKILVSLNQPYQLATHNHYSTPSIGVTLFSNHGKSQDELLKQADIAMYQAKKAGRNTLRFFDPHMQDSIAIRVALESDLRQAITEQKQFQLYYQVQVDSTGSAIGAEALLRWHHPVRGMVTPANFIPLAEESGLILPLCHWILNTACRQLAAWATQPETAHLTLSVNISVKQLHMSDFVEEVLNLVNHCKIDPAKLKLEITESMLLGNVNDTIIKMAALNASGVNFSIDDFGTGYSSLQYLKLLPLHQLKIDQSFVRDIATDDSDKAIVRTIIAIAKSLGLTVIAEGVETKEQQQLLMGGDCAVYQGYLFGRPLPIGQFNAQFKQG